jgi:signal transduction histidine kinase
MKAEYGLADPVEPQETHLANAGIVHDLGNLIQIAASAVNIVARSPTMPTEHSRPILHRATICLEQAGALVRQTIGIARDGAATLGDCCVTACLADVAALVEAMDEPGLALEIDIERELPRALCDPLGLRSAVLNLVFNARDAMAGIGLVAIRGRAISCGLAGISVEISVTDNGVGMSPATVARALDPFFTTKSNGLGGVGLPMVERFVREAGGTISIASEPGIGTAVALRLPA